MDKKKLSLKEIGIEKLVILFIAGIVLLILSVPGFQKSENSPGSAKLDKTVQENGKTGAEVLSDSKEYTTWMEKRLTDTLGEVEGIGRLKVMITLKGTSEKVTLKDKPFTQENSSESDTSGGSRVSSSATREDETVLISEETGESVPYVVKEIEPEIEGVLVLTEGGGNSNLKKEIVEAVQVLFDVPAHKIKVMKMEGAHN